MALPGFSADQSLYQSSSYYVAGIGSSALGAGGIAPAGVLDVLGSMLAWIIGGAVVGGVVGGPGGLVTGGLLAGLFCLFVGGCNFN